MVDTRDERMETAERERESVAQRMRFEKGEDRGEWTSEHREGECEETWMSCRGDGAHVPRSSVFIQFSSAGMCCVARTCTQIITVRCGRRFRRDESVFFIVKPVFIARNVREGGNLHFKPSEKGEDCSIVATSIGRSRSSLPTPVFMRPTRTPARLSACAYDLTPREMETMGGARRRA